MHPKVRIQNVNYILGFCKSKNITHNFWSSFQYFDFSIFVCFARAGWGQNQDILDFSKKKPLSIKDPLDPKQSS